MDFTVEDVFSGIERASNYIPVESLSMRYRFGEHKSGFRDGRDFYQIREYEPETDSAADILWHLREPSGKVYVRETNVTKEFIGIVLADLSASMIYKSRLLLETIGNIGLTFFHGQDPMGLIGFSEGIIIDEEPRVGEGNIYYLLNQLYKYLDHMFKEKPKSLKSHTTDMAKALDFFLQRYYNKQCFVMVVSDFIGCEDIINSPLLQEISNQNEVVFIFLDNPEEFKVKLPIGYLRRGDVEKGTTQFVSLKKMAKKIAEDRVNRKQFRDDLWNEMSVGSTVLEYGKHFDRLSRFFLIREEMFRI